MQQEARGAASARVAGGAGTAREGTSARAGRFEVDGVTVRFGGLTALDACQPARGAGRGARGHRPERRRQDDAVQRRLRLLAPDERDRCAGAARSCKGLRPAPAGGLGISRTLQGVGLFAGLTVLENVMIGAHRAREGGLRVRAARPARAADKDERALRERATAALDRAGRRAATPTATRAACPTRCRSASRSPAPSSPSPTCCCSTSRPPGCPTTRWTSSAS